ncbi:extracellular matrix regulator RemB [Mesobacillus harenae]|uniref:extracellular matrix regulator RemB n=1 Tax=Mesobacillus harenae TaxID=2213203 RepID=UPI001580EC06|nr:extracellular matrix/biofilm biosynthesis regulator RemA family protein [Mesobacillus harenae]
MYLHVGEGILVRTRDIITILDKDSAKSSPYLEEFVQFRKDDVINLSRGEFKSIVITNDKVYYSPLASGTLKKRSQKLSIQEF